MPVIARTLLASIVLSQLACGVSEEDLTYWTRYYEHLMATGTHEIQFRKTLECSGQSACACAVPLRGSPDFKIDHVVVYSSSPTCGFQDPKKLAREVNCQIRMTRASGENVDHRALSECSEFFEELSVRS